MSGLPLDVDDLIDDCEIPGGLTIRRAGQAVKNRYGGFDPAPTTSINISPATVHNLIGRDLDQLPEAGRNSEAVRAYTKSRIFVQDGGQAADILEYQGRNWRCTQVLDYSIQGGVFVSTFTLQDVQQPVT